MGIFWTILVGLFVGVVAKLLHPGRENMGMVMTVLLGIGASFLAGVVGKAIGWYEPGEGAGLVASVVMAIVILVIYGRIRGGNTPGGQ